MKAQNSPHGTPERICIQRLSHLGDVVHALPVFHALRRKYPAARIAWVVQPEFAGLLQGIAGLAEVIPFERRGGLWAWWRLRRKLRAFRADLAVDCQANWKSGLATRLSGAKRRVGLHASNWREHRASWCCNELAPEVPRTNEVTPHAVSRMLHLASYVGELPANANEGGRLPHDPHFDLLLTREEFELGNSELRSRLPGRAPVILHLGTGRDPRSWPTSNFAELARLLAKRNRGVLILSGPAEATSGAQVQAELADVSGISHWVGQRGLRQLAAFLQAAARSDADFVSADSGPMHLAWASGLPVTLLAGPQSETATGPWPLTSARDSPHLALGASSSSLPCRPCFKRVCFEDSEAEFAPCMQEITPLQVLESLS